MESHLSLCTAGYTTEQERAWIENRLSQLSARESIVLAGALAKDIPFEGKDAVNLLLKLDEYEVCYPAGSITEL